MAPPSPTAQSRARPGIMAAACVRPMLVAQGTQGSASLCGGALSSPGLCPRIWKRRSRQRAVRAGGWGESPGIRLQPLGKEAGGSHSASEPSPPFLGCPAWPQSQTHPRWAHPQGHPALAGTRPTTSPSPVTFPPIYTLTDINSQTLCTTSCQSGTGKLGDTSTAPVS